MSITATAQITITNINDGRSLVSMEQQYYLSTSAAAVTGGAWVDAKPPAAGTTYVWTRFRLVWANPSDITYTEAAMLDDAMSSMPYVKGTQTTDTASWTGNAPTISALYAGLTIRYFLNRNPSGNATLNLVLKDGTATGAINCYYSGTARLTTHYAKGSVLTLTYLPAGENALSGTAGWFCTPQYYNSDNYTYRYYNTIKAKTAIASGSLCCALDETGFSTLSAGGSFDINYPILWASGALAAGSTTSGCYSSYYCVNLASTLSGFAGLTAFKGVYLVGTLNGTLFTVDSTMFTQIVPAAADGKVYMRLGEARSTNSIYLSNEKKFFKFANGLFRLMPGDKGERGVPGVSGDNGEPGEPGTPAYVFSLKADRSTYTRDLRQSANATVVGIVVDVQGYAGVPVLSSSFGTVSAGLLSIPCNTAPDSITITATLAGVGAKSIVLDVIDRTVYNLYLGELGALPASSSVLDGDYFLCTSAIANTICRAGIPYEYIAGAWSEMSSNDTDRMMHCLGGMLSSQSLQTYSGALYGWFKNLVSKSALIEGLTSNEAFITRLKAVSALFDHISVTGDSTFGGEITSPALKTQNSENASLTLSASGGAAAQGNANTVSAVAVSGRQVKNNIAGKAATLSDKTPYAAGGSILGRTDFDRIMRVSSVSGSSAVLASKSGSSAMTAENLSWTNDKPIPIVVHIACEAKKTRESYTDYDYSWEVTHTDTYVSWGPKPQSDFVPFNPSVGDTYWTYSTSSTGDIAYIDGVSWPTYTVTARERTYVMDSSTVYDYQTGSVTVVNDGLAMNGSTFTVAGGKSVVITLSRPAQIHQNNDDYAESSSKAGFASISWVESENYAAGVMFIANSRLSFYLADLTDEIVTSSNSLAIGGDAVLDLPTGSATAWTFSSSYGAIYKLVPFSWSNTQSGTATQFSGTPVATYSDVNGFSHSAGTLVSASYTPSSIVVIGSESFTLSSSIYVSSFSINMALIAQPGGVYAQNLYPQQSSRFDLGGTVNGAIRYWRNAYIATLTAGDILPGSGGKILGNSSNPWSSATITAINGTTITGAAVWGAVAN